LDLNIPHVKEDGSVITGDSLFSTGEFNHVNESVKNLKIQILFLINSTSEQLRFESEKMICDDKTISPIKEEEEDERKE
jgi:hypothetical protein